MSLDRSAELKAQGFEHVTTRPVALPHTVWTVAMTVAFDRQLTLAERTILGLVGLGHHAPSELEHLMGVDPDVIVKRNLVSLLGRGLLQQDGHLTLTEQGKRALQQDATREERPYVDLELRYLPYARRFVWHQPGEIRSPHRVKQDGLHELPTPPRLRPLDVESRVAEVQELLEAEGFPFDRDDQKPPRRDIVHLQAGRSERRWVEAELQVWHHADDDLWEWVLRHRDGEFPEVTRTLRDLHDQGEDIIPLETLEPPTPLGEVGKALGILHQVVSDEASPASTAPEMLSDANVAVLQADEHRRALEEAIRSARSELLIVSPWLRTDAVDHELLGWLEDALRRHNELRVVVGYGIEADDPSRKDWKSRNQREARDRLNTLGRDFKGRLRTLEIGNTREKLVIVDRKLAIVTSFNFLSYNPKPGKGIRREMGTVVRSKEAIQVLRDQLAGPLGLATS